MPDTIIKIAIADDLGLIRSGIITLLNLRKYNKVILEAKDGIELINQLSLLKQLPDICIIETNNKILNNYQTLIDLQKLFPQIKVLALSCYDLKYTVIKMIQHGIRGYLSKKISTNQFLSAIEDLHKNDYCYSEIASEHTFETARQVKLPELTFNELQLLSFAADRCNQNELSAVKFIQEDKSEDIYYPIIKKLMLHDRLGLFHYMAQSGLVAERHFV
ncbi:MAG: response regulator transcription factor [Legionellales bacterium]